MRKKLIGLIAVLIIFSIGLGAYFLFGNEPIEEPVITTAPAATPVPKAVIYDFDIKDTKYITIKNHGEEPYKLNHIQKLEANEMVSTYEIADADNSDSSEDDIGTIFSFMASLKGKEVDLSVMAGAGDEDFGFDKATVVTMEMTDGVKYVLEVGDYTTTSDGTYVRKQGDTKVYIITYGEGLYLKGTVNDLKNLYLFTATPGTDFINKITMYKNGVLNYTLKGEISEDESTEVWEVAEPIFWRVTTDSPFIYYTQQFYNIKASKCIGKTDNLKQYGLEIPQYDIEFYMNSKKYKLSLGNKTEDGTGYYARWNDKTDVYTISTELFPSIDKNLQDMVSKLVYSCAYYDLSKFEIKLKNEEYIFDIETQGNEKTNDAFRYQGKLFTESAYPDVCNAFRMLYKGCLSLYVYEFDSAVSPELKNPEITMKYHNKKDKEIVVLDYVKRDEDRYYIFMNGNYTGAMARISTIYNATDNLEAVGLVNALADFKEIFKTVT